MSQSRDKAGMNMLGFIIQEERNIYGFAAVCALGLAIVSCAMLANTGVFSARPALPVIPVQSVNVKVRPGYSEHFDAQLGEDVLLVNVPKSGVYLLTYVTDTAAPSYIVTQVKSHSAFIMELQPGDNVVEVSIVEGDASHLAATSPEVQHFGSAVVFYTSGKIGTWGDYFTCRNRNPRILYRSDSRLRGVNTYFNRTESV